MVIILGVCLTYVLFNTFYKWIDKGWLPDTEPFNCSFCISFWLSFGLFLLSLDVYTWYIVLDNWRIDIPVWIAQNDPLVVVIPLAYYVVERIINRI